MMRYTVTTETREGKTDTHQCKDWRTVEYVLFLLERTDWHAYQVAVVAECS